MKNMLAALYAKPLVSYLIATLIAVSTFAAPAEAMLLPTAPPAPASAPIDRAADLNLIQRTLEAQVLQQRLTEYGLTKEQALERLNTLSDEQVHQFASRIEMLQAGGRRNTIDIEVVLLILLVVLLILLIVENTPTDRGYAV
jgi:Family of unknown function (DUF6627)